MTESCLNATETRSGDAPARRAREYLVIGIVDDDAGLETMLARWAPALFDDEHAVVLQVTTVADATVLLETAVEGIDVILVDGHIPYRPTDGLLVMDKLRAAGYTGPMVAISSDDLIGDRMVKAGCVAACSKLKVSQLERVIRELLGTTT